MTDSTTDSTRALFVLITMQNADGEILTSGHDLTVRAGSRTHDLLTYVLTERVAPHMRNGVVLHYSIHPAVIA